MAPTFKTMMLIEQTPDLIKIRVITRNKDVPYCDTFGIEEDWFIMSKPKTKCCVVRMTVVTKWFKSTMMKSLITSSIDSGT